MLVICVVELVGINAGAGAPGLSTCPATTEIATVRLRIVTAHVCRKVFTYEPPRELQKICNFDPDKHDRSGNTLQGQTDYVRFALGSLVSFPCNNRRSGFT